MIKSNFENKKENRMKMKNIIIIVLLIFSLNVITSAQNQDEIYLHQNSLNAETPSSMNYDLNLESVNQANINQVGSQNMVTLFQFLDYQYQPGNLADIYQYGLNNSANVTISGNNNYYSLEQDGNNNITEAELNGYSNIFNVLQSGNSNELISTIKGDDLKYKLEQFGNGNSLIQLENSNNSKGYSVIQSGNGMKINITNGLIK